MNRARVFILLVMLVAVGCEKEEHNQISDIPPIVRSARTTEKYWEERLLRWVEPTSMHKDKVDNELLENLLSHFVTNTASYFKCSVPLFIKFAKDYSIRKDRSDGRFSDIRENPDYPYTIEALLFGNGDAILQNRLYFTFSSNEHVTVWSRRIDNLDSSISFRPRKEKTYRDDMGVYSLNKEGLAPIFLGDENFCLDDFLNQVLSRQSRLYWWCGLWSGLSEGKHIYNRDEFEQWIAFSPHLVVPLKVVFAAHNTYVFSIDVLRGTDAY